MDDENKKVPNPFGAGSPGANAFRAAYDRLKAEADAARGNITQNYAGAYQQLRQQTYGQGLGAASQAGLSGGQAGMMRNRVSAGQMQALGGLMQGQEAAMRQQKAMEGSIYSNALLEGQQTQGMETERLARISAIMGDKAFEELTPAQQNQLLAEGYKPEATTAEGQPIGGYYNTIVELNDNRPRERRGYKLVKKMRNIFQGGGWYWTYEKI